MTLIQEHVLRLSHQTLPNRDHLLSAPAQFARLTVLVPLQQWKQFENQVQRLAHDPTAQPTSMKRAESQVLPHRQIREDLVPFGYDRNS